MWVFIYNNQYFFPDTIERIKRNSKIVFILGDNPLWSKTFNFNLTILKHADLVLSPDSHWQFELNMIGINNIEVDFIGSSRKHFYPISDISENFRSKYGSDLLFIGRNYHGSSGYKRALFLNNFVGMDFKIFGSREWEKWLNYFPLLKDHFYPINGRISFDELNIALNCTKVYPIDQNTGIINGLHLRVFEAIGSGTLPIVEWRKDIDSVFGDILPVIRNYSEAKALASHYLDSEGERKQLVESLRNHIDLKYKPENYVQRMLKRLKFM